MRMGFNATGILKDTEFYLGSLSPEQVSAIHNSAVADLGRLSEAETVCFVIGSYDRPQKDRLHRTCERLENEHGFAAFLLEEIDPGVDGWRNFYVKFRVLLSRVDHIVAVIEDNDGGHELELGEADLSDVYVLKRDYTGPSIDNDIEYEKYDAMLGTLCDLLSERGRLYKWATVGELDGQIDELAVTLESGER